MEWGQWKCPFYHTEPLLSRAATRDAAITLELRAYPERGEGCDYQAVREVQGEKEPGAYYYLLDFRLPSLKMPAY